MKINWLYIKGVLLLGLVVFLVGFSNQRNSTLKVTDVIIEFEKGNNLFMNYQIVNKLLIQNGKTVRNKEKSVIDLQKLEANILAHPMVEDATVFLTINGELRAKVRQRTPVARVILSSGSYYIDRQGERMPLSELHTERVLIISGEIAPNDLKKIHLLVTEIRNDYFLNEMIIDIQKMEDGTYNLRTRIGDQIIIFGKIEEIKHKLKNLNSFFNKALRDGSIGNYSLINLNYKNQVVCTKVEEYGTE